MKRVLITVLCLIMGLSMFACAKDLPVDETQPYNTAKQSENMLHFSSSDKAMDDFLNDYLHRHLRYDDYRIGELSLGNSVMFNKEWEAMSLFFFDSTSNTVPDDRVLMMENYLDNIPVDRFGYTWQAFDSTEPSIPDSNEGTIGEIYFGQGWPFPAYPSSAGQSAGWEFNSDSNEGWSTYVGGVDVTSTTVSNLGYLPVNYSKVSDVEFVSPRTSISAFHSPFLQIDLRITDSTGFANVSSIEDVYVYFMTSGDNGFSEKKMVKYSDFATITKDITGSFISQTYLPMYLHPEWGTDVNNIITNLRIEVRAKEGQTLSGSTIINYVRGNYDTRHTNNAALLLRAAKLHYEYTGKAEVLERNLSRYRSSLMFLLKTCGGESGLISQEYFIGHQGTEKGIGTSIGQGYWDLLSTPNYSLYSNVYFYKALESMIYLEEMAAALGIESEAPTVANGTDTSVITWSYTVDQLKEILAKTKAGIQADVDTAAKTGFWDEEKGRFIEGFNAGGKVVDYGFIMFNLEVIAAGIATQEQAEKIMSWVSGEREIESDKAAGGQNYASGKVGSAVDAEGKINTKGSFGIYDLEFAPRSTTLKNSDQYYWRWPGTNAFGGQVQDGGAIMYVSYYDIMSRISTRGATDGYQRLKEIQKWYNKVEKVAEAMGVDTTLPSTQFYRAYYQKLGIKMQGGNSAGGVGLDYEFLESAILYAAVPYGFFGLGSNEYGKLTVAPSLPESLTWWKMENLAYSGIVYDLAVGKDFVEIDCVRGDSYGKTVTVTLPAKSGQSVYVDGIKADSSKYTVADSKASIELPFAKCKVEIR